VFLYRLNGSYEALIGGLSSEALTDFTGGVVVMYDLSDGHLSDNDLQKIVTRAFDSGSLMTCSISVRNIFISLGKAYFVHVML